MANYFDFTYGGKKTDPESIIVWEQNYETGEVETKEYDVDDYLYYYIDAMDREKAVPGITSQRGTMVQKVKAQNFKALRDGSSAKFFHGMKLNTYESDIEPLYKVMLDNYGRDNQKSTTWNLALYDIETDVQLEDTFMEMRESANRIINAISVWYMRPNKFLNFTVVPPLLQLVWNFDKVEIRGKFEIRYFRTEAEMLEAFFKTNKEYETIAMGAWNGDFFDTAYIFERAKRLWKEKGAAERMGRYPRVSKNKITVGDKTETIIRPIGMIWYDCLEAFKKNGPELESFALNAVAEEVLGTSKLEFDGSFEYLYHGERRDRTRFELLTPEKNRESLILSSEIIWNTIADDYALYSKAKDGVQSLKTYESHEIESRIQIKMTELMEELFQDNEFKYKYSHQLEEIERFTLFKKLKDTYSLFLDYSNQDSQLLHDLEKQLNKFNTLMMLAQYNVAAFHDVFSTLNQVEQGITNFAHLYNNKVVIDRNYVLENQPYNKFVDKRLLKLQSANEHRIGPDDSDEVKRMKTLIQQTKIPGAAVLLPNIGLISFNEEETPPLVAEFKKLKEELREINRLLEEFECSDDIDD